MKFEDYDIESFGIYAVWSEWCGQEYLTYQKGMNAWECSNIQQPLSYKEVKNLYEEGKLSHIFDEDEE